jgi:hypothetical protein
MGADTIDKFTKKSNNTTENNGNTI